MNREFSVYDQTDNDPMKENIFFGQNVNVARYDQQKHEIFEKLAARQLSLFWVPEEINLSKDTIDFNKLPEHEKHIFTSNLQYQILLDSVQGRGPSVTLLPICSSPEFESFILAWSFFESIHSRSYGHIIRNLYSNPSEVFDTIVPSKEIAKRASAVTKLYDKLESDTQAWRRGEIPVREAKKSLMLCMASINILEGVRFFVSFACSFAFAERKIMEGNAKVIRLIARKQHCGLAW